MLRRRSIRTKLVVALGLLTSIVLLLAFSGFWGLYGYRSLANSVSQRAEEMPHANDLNRLAETLRDSNSRMNDMILNGGMIDAGLLDNPMSKLEQCRYAQTMFDLRVRIQLYRDAISGIHQGSNLLIDADHQRFSLDKIDQSVAELVAFHRSPRSLDYNGKSELSRRLDSLVELTQEHLSNTHSELAEFSQDVRGQYRTWIGVAWVCTIISLIVVGVLLWSLHSLVVKPFQTLLDGSRLVAKGQLSHWIDLGTNDELNELAMAMNDMTKRFKTTLGELKSVNSDLDRQVRERSREVIQNEQLASVGFLAAGVAHEINNPLATIAWSAESLESRVEETVGFASGSAAIDNELLTAMRLNLRRIQEEAFRCKGITERLLDFSRLGDVQRSTTNLTQLVEEIVAMVSKVGKYRCKTMRTHQVGDVFAHVNAQEIRQVILNLITNALESVDTDGAVDIYIKQVGCNACVAVQDNGCGMSAEVLQHLFEPFFTRRRDGTGTGLGLSITYRIVSQHGGSLIAQSDGEGCGSRLQLLLPCQAAAPRDIESDSNRSDLNTLEPNTLELNTTEWNHESIKAA
ncbi:Sensor protein ZraS [Novipirellula aureliae]|uniref:histidine kinase n=1 Tax=Novipirellula aureliae TaxID=2527966 RepID=A0A5C6DN86_9BACT|nr:HAMP domain-containing sensor histidine kinase [Novipirellula aureliae]TWU38733.1 Sensor protein ZraS [Novipirellula aureliae]